MTYETGVLISRTYIEHMFQFNHYTNSKGVAEMHESSYPHPPRPEVRQTPLGAAAGQQGHELWTRVGKWLSDDYSFKRGLTFGIILAVALVSFEIFNFSFTTGHFLRGACQRRPGWADAHLGTVPAGASRVEIGSDHSGRCGE